MIEFGQIWKPILGIIGFIVEAIAPFAGATVYGK